jgi:hypothetical protein
VNASQVADRDHRAGEHLHEQERFDLPIDLAEESATVTFFSDSVGR